MQTETNITKQILSTLKEIKEDLREVKEKLEEAPPYGSDAWWRWSDSKSMEDMKAGRYKSFKSPQEFSNYLNSLK